MKTVALLARKGGTGKTSVAIHMGVLAEAAGRKVTFLDLDPQKSLTEWWNGRIHSTPNLIAGDVRQLPALLKVASDGGFDLTIIDTPPAVSFETALVAATADLVLIPLRPSILDIRAVDSTAAIVRSSKTRALLVLNACLPPQMLGEASATLDARKALEALEMPVAATSLAQRVDYQRALNDGEAVNEFAPDSRAAAEMKRLWAEVEQELQ